MIERDMADLPFPGTDIAAATGWKIADAAPDRQDEERTNAGQSTGEALISQ
jgi:hypothetical protein